MPIIHGFLKYSHLLRMTTSNGRVLNSYEPDLETDDIYLFDFNTSHNERVSKVHLVTL